MAKAQLTPKEENALARWDRFLEDQLGCYPATIAALALRMTTSGVYQAADRGWISFYQVGRNRWYGRKDVIRYRHEVSKKFPSNRNHPSAVAKNYSEGFLPPRIGVPSPGSPPLDSASSPGSI